jgi:hypothetical protein
MPNPTVTLIELVNAIVDVCNKATARGAHLKGEEIHAAVLDLYPTMPGTLFRQAIPLAVEELNQQAQRHHDDADALGAVSQEAQLISQESGVPLAGNQPLDEFLITAAATGNTRASRLLEYLQSRGG